MGFLIIRRDGEKGYGVGIWWFLPHSSVSVLVSVSSLKGLGNGFERGGRER